MGCSHDHCWSTGEGHWAQGHLPIGSQLPGTCQVAWPCPLNTAPLTRSPVWSLLERCERSRWGSLWQFHRHKPRQRVLPPAPPILLDTGVTYLSGLRNCCASSEDGRSGGEIWGWEENLLSGAPCSHYIIAFKYAGGAFSAKEQLSWSAADLCFRNKVITFSYKGSRTQRARLAALSGDMGPVQPRTHYEQVTDLSFSYEK